MMPEASSKPADDKGSRDPSVLSVKQVTRVRPTDIWATFAGNMLSGVGYLVFVRERPLLGTLAILGQIAGELARLVVMALTPVEKRWTVQGRYNTYVTYPSALLSLIVLGQIYIPGSLFYLTVIATSLFSLYNLLVLKSRFLSWALAVALTIPVVVELVTGLRGLEMYSHIGVYLCTLTIQWRLGIILKEYEGGILRQAEELRTLTLMDKVTGLPNRDLFNERLAYLTAMAKRKGSMLSIIAFDVDDFAGHNRILGTEGADQLLRQLAQRTRQVLRTSDLVSRWSGDRFYILGEIGEEQSSLSMIEKIRQDLGSPFEVNGKHVRLTASFGVATFPRDAEDEKALVVAAEKALRLAKMKKPMGLALFDNQAEKAMGDRMAMQEALGKALGGGEFILNYQPKYTPERVLDSMEILLRWKSPKYGVVSPVVFIPLLEQSGMIKAVGDWIFHEASRQMTEWQGAGKALVPLAINVSVQQCLDPAFGGRTISFVEHCGLPPGLFEVELTESLFADKSDAILKVLNDFRSLGMHTAVDDFGTGYSSLVRLAELPIDVIKIDKAFVDQIGQSRDTETVIELILQMAKALRRRTVAEGVEHLEQVTFLADRGCPLFQGYYFSKPLPAADAGRLLLPG